MPRGWAAYCIFKNLFTIRTFSFLCCSALCWQGLRCTPLGVGIAPGWPLLSPRPCALSPCAACSRGGCQSRRTRPFPGTGGRADSRRRLAQPKDFWEKPQPTWSVTEANLAPKCLPFSVGGRTGRGGFGAEVGVQPGWLPSLPLSSLGSHHGRAAFLRAVASSSGKQGKRS